MTSERSNYVRSNSKTIEVLARFLPEGSKNHDKTGLLLCGKKKSKIADCIKQIFSFSAEPIQQFSLNRKNSVLKLLDD